MVVVTKPEIGKMVLNEINNATKVLIAVAYFSPDNELLSALSNVPSLTLIISEEFVINNPYKIEELSATTSVLSVPPDHVDGKLHGKVSIVTRPNGEEWALIGSANMTWQGMFSNQEACIALDSKSKEDREPLESLNTWFESLRTKARHPDLERAKLIYDERSLYRINRRPRNKDNDESSTCYWVLKTTSGATGEDHWQRFLSESVIAIGWSAIKGDPSKLTDPQLIDAVAVAYPEKNPLRTAKKIRKFINLSVGDIVLICRGYNSTQKKPVYVYGFARVCGEFHDDRSSSWIWRFKHRAVIQEVNMNLPMEEVAEVLEKNTLLETIHQIDRSKALCLANKLGVRLEV